MPPGTKAVERVPVELWLEIFKHVPRSTDLLSLSKASRKFNSITTRALHRDLIWEKEEAAAHNLGVWPTDKEMASCVRSVVLGIGGTPANRTPAQNAAILHDYVWPSTLNRLTPAERQDLLTPSSLILSTRERVQIVLWARVETFTNLSSVVFKDITISNGHFLLFHNLGQLHSLSLIGCTVDGAAAHGLNNQILPITELTMINVRGGHGAIPHAHANFAPVQQVAGQVQPPVVPDPYAHVLSLATAANLRILIVSSIDVFRHVFSAPGAQARGWVAPPMLEHLYVLQRRTITTRRRGGEEPLYDAYLYNFCSQAHSLKTISAPDSVMSEATMDPARLPPSLEAFAGPLDTAQFVAVHRDLKALGVLKCRLATDEVIQLLTVIAIQRPGLEVLVLEVETWDAEIMTAISRNFKQLRRLKLVYGRHGPNKNYLVKLGEDSLVELPELHTLEMYRLPPRGEFEAKYPTRLFPNKWASIEEEMRGIVVPWTHRRCQKLRRVQLVSGYVLTRGFEDAFWKMEKVYRLKRIEYLDY